MTQPRAAASGVVVESSREQGTNRGTKGGIKSEAELLELADRHILKNYRQAPFVLARGSGCELFDTEGRRYLDFAAGVAVCSVGHAHPLLAARLAAQATELVHSSNYFYNDKQVLLAAELARRTGMDRVFFCNSGAEALEAALKLVRRFHFLAGKPEKHRLVAFERSFHGRTMGALALTGNPKYHEGFAPGVGAVTHVPFGDLEAVRRVMGPDVAGIFVEPVQGEGGVSPAPEGYLAGLRALCDEHGALLVLDEVQTGVGRTGTFLATEQDRVKGDVITLAKGLGGGVPIGAMLCTERVAGALGPGTHGSTFGGNPLAASAALTVLEILDGGVLEGVAAKGQRLAAGLRGLVGRFPRVITEEKGRGLMRGIVLAKPHEPRAALDFLREEGLLLTAAGADVLRYTPPLVVTDAQIDEAIAATERALARLGAP